jgi:hypothetical protein
MSRMIRKQILLEARQSEALKRLAQRTGKSEGALIREAVERRLMEEQEADTRWEALVARWSEAPVTGTPRTWTRDDLYTERLGQFHADTH